MIRRNSNGVVFRNSAGYILGSVYSLKLTVIGNVFPRVQNNAAIGSITLIFSEATTVTINYGDGVITRYNTALVNGLHRFSIYQKGTTNTSTPPATDITAHTYSDGNTTASRGVTFVFDNNLLVSFTMTALTFPVQPLEFVFSAFPNLATLDINSLSSAFGGTLNGVFSSFNFNGYATSNITSFSTALAFTNTLIFASVVPEVVFTLPLITLGVGGIHNTKSFADSNFNKIALLKDTLTILRLSVPFTDAQGLPANLSDLKKLKEFQSFNAAAWPSGFPSVIRNMTWLERATIQNSNVTIDCGDLSNMTALRYLNLSVNTSLSTTPNPTIKNCPLLKQLSLQSSFGNTTRVDAFINNMFAYVVANAPLTGVDSNVLRGMTIGVEQASGVQAGIVTGVYRKPEKNVQTITITNGGSGYTTAPTVAISGAVSSGGTIAAATAIITAGVVTSITITNAGHRYTDTPVITLNGGGGSGATAVAALSVDYVQGVTNGNPATPREKIWVMVNQYNHIWTYRAV